MAALGGQSCHGCSAGLSPEQHRDHKRPQGLQQQWGTQGLKGSSFSSLGLAPLRSRKCCWYRVPWGDGTGWDGGDQLNCRRMGSAFTLNSQRICAASASAVLSHWGWGDKGDQHSGGLPVHCHHPSAPWRAGGSVTCSSWSTVSEPPNSQLCCFHSISLESILQLSGQNGNIQHFLRASPSEASGWGSSSALGGIVRDQASRTEPFLHAAEVLQAGISDKGTCSHASCGLPSKAPPVSPTAMSAEGA